MPYLAGQTIKAAELNAWLPRFVVKAGSEPRTNNTTPSADADLIMTVPAGTAWHLMYRLYLAGGTGDWKGNLSWTNTATVSYSILGPGTGAAANANAADVAVGPTTRLDTASPGLDMICGTIGAGSMLELEARVAAAAGADVVVTLNWAQNVSDATASQILNGSHISGIRLL